MGYIHLTQFSGPPAQLQISTPNGSAVYVYPYTIFNNTPMPLDINLPSTFNGENTIILSAYSSTNGCSFIGQASCGILETPTPTPFYCYYIGIAPIDGVWIAGDDIQVLDCNGNYSAYTASTSAINYLCLQSATANTSYDVIEPEGNCFEVLGEWYPYDPIDSPTPTPTQAVTPTPSSTLPAMMAGVQFIYDATVATLASIKLQKGLLPLTINWGDGNVSAYTTSNSVQSHTYTSPSTGYITISGATEDPNELPGVYNFTFFGNVPITGETSEIGKLIELTQLETEIFVTGDILELSACTNMGSIFTKSNDISGNINDLPDGARFVTIIGENTLGGDMSDLPPYILELSVGGYNTISGDTSDLLSYSLNLIYIDGYNTVSGLVESLSAITSVYMKGYNTISGDIYVGPNTEYLIIDGYNTIGGDIALSQPLHMNSLIEFFIDGYNTIYGNLAMFMFPEEHFGIGGNNTISGNTLNLEIPDSMWIFRLDNIAESYPSPYIGLSTTGNTLTGDISYMSHPSLVSIYLGGNNTVYGNSGELLISQLYVISTGNTINGITPNPIVTEAITADVRLYTESATYLNATQVNNFLVDTYNNVENSNFAIIVLLGNHAAPTGAGLTAKNDLINNGATVITN